MKYSGGVGHGPRRIQLNFDGDPDSFMDPG